jgi:hypothetical protein
MQLFNIVREIGIGFLESIGQSWWLEIETTAPRCTYYFGPFEKSKEAKTAREGYIEDLQGEGAQGIKVNLRRFQPKVLTIDGESEG